jgi:hypothetical protein
MEQTSNPPKPVFPRYGYVGTGEVQYVKGTPNTGSRSLLPAYLPRKLYHPVVEKCSTEGHFLPISQKQPATGHGASDMDETKLWRVVVKLRCRTRPAVSETHTSSICAYE